MMSMLMSYEQGESHMHDDNIVEHALSYINVTFSRSLSKCAKIGWENCTLITNTMYDMASNHADNIILMIRSYFKLQYT